MCEYCDPHGIHYSTHCVCKRVCSKCNIEKGRLGFYKNKYSPDGMKSVCKDCERPRVAKHYTQYEKERRTLRHKNRSEDIKKYLSYINLIWTTYRLREQDFRDLQDKQKGCCAICGVSLAKPIYSMNNCHVDHCHTTGKVRGLLCGDCNSLLGYSKDNVTTLGKAIAYLKGE